MHQFSLERFIKYPDQGLTKLKGLAVQNDFHFILLLKAIRDYDSSTGRLRPLNAIFKSDLSTIETLLNITPVTKGKTVQDFQYHMNSCTKRGWIKQNQNSFNIISINKINSLLNFKLFTNKETDRKYYSYRRLYNIQGMDLQATRIFQIIKLKQGQFQHVIESPKDNCQITSSVNHKMITDLQRSKSKGKYSGYFGISIDKICEVGGYGSKTFVHNKLKTMEKQGLKIKKDRSPFDRFKKRECNKYDTSFDGVFITEYVKPAKALSEVSQVEVKFNTVLNSTANRLRLIEAGIVSNYFRTKRDGSLVKIPKRCFSKILIGILNDEDARCIFLKHFSSENIKVSTERKRAMFTKFLNSEERFGSITVSKVELVNSGGNYRNQYLTTYAEEVKKVNNRYKCFKQESVCI